MDRKFKFGVLLSGCGVYDGAEIHEAVSVLLALDKMGIEAVCIAPDVEQHHVINHLTGEEMPEKRNVLVEAARIARGAITEISKVNVDELDALVMPGGFGVAKNFTKWAFEGPKGAILESVKNLIQAFYKAKKTYRCGLYVAYYRSQSLRRNGKRTTHHWQYHRKITLRHQSN
jgi:enhancing lycopene biosynthesis protein 2